MTQSSGTIRVVIPLAIRKRNGRPKILPPADMEVAEPTNQGPHVLRAVARAWGWRRKLETGAASTIQDIAAAEKISDRFVGRMMRLAYRSGFGFGFHSRAIFCASAICAGVILAATKSRLLMASASPLTAARFHHMCACM